MEKELKIVDFLYFWPLVDGSFGLYCWTALELG